MLVSFCKIAKSESGSEPGGLKRSVRHQTERRGGAISLSETVGEKVSISLTLD